MESKRRVPDLCRVSIQNPPILFSASTVKSLDQTTRIHGAIPNKTVDVTPSWHEVSRPQVHGYDLLGVTFLDALRFVSIADEKVARVFEAPRGFVHVVKGLQISNLESEEVSL